MFEDILYGIGGGISWSVFSYVNKLRANPDLEFKFSKLAYSGALGAVVGIVASMMKVDFTSANALLATFAGTAVLNEAFKWLWLKLGWTNPPTGKR